MLRILQHKDVVYTIKNSPYKLTKSFVIILANFVITWYIANFHSGTFLGQYTYITSVMGLMIIFTLPGIKSAIVESVSKGQLSSFVYGTKLAFKYSIAGSLVLISIALYYRFYIPSFVYFWSFLVLALLFPFYYTLDNYLSYFVGTFQFKRELQSTIVLYLLVILLSLGALIIIQNIIIFLIIYYVAQIVVHGFYYNICKKDIKVKLNNKLKNRLKKNAIFFTKIDALTHIANNIDRVLVGFMLSPEILAVYAVASMAPNKYKSLVNPVLHIFFPAFSKKEMKFTIRKIWWLVGFSIIMSLLLVLITPIALIIFFPKYTFAILLSILLIIPTVFVPLNTVFGHFFRAENYNDGVRNPVMYSKLLSIVITAPSILLWGVHGLILSKIFEHGFNLVLNFYYYKTGDYIS